tara:strand:- start:668 stop:850 length:183 start_codon:yes stop_codon:yes gene_type:complete
MIDHVYYFLGGAYIVGTLFGLWVGYRRGVYVGTEHSVDQLVKDGYLKTRGEEILRYNEGE